MLDEYGNRVCDVCGRPEYGPDRCPHAINTKYPCPRDEKRERERKRMRNIGI